jgi:hypothetical protein
MITSLAATHSPDELQMYFFDFGGRGLMYSKLCRIAASIRRRRSASSVAAPPGGDSGRTKSVLSQARVDL